MATPVSPKFWVREGGKIFFKKTGQVETIYAEVLADQVCEALGVPHVEFKLDTHHG